MTTEVRGERQGTLSVVVRVSSAALLAASGGVHLDLYLTGYRYIPVIGWMFLAQVVAAFALSVALLVTVQIAHGPVGRLVAGAAAGFALSTIGGYLISLQFGLLGFHETRTSAGIAASAIELAAFVMLATQALGGRRALSARQAGYLVGPWTGIAAILLLLAEIQGGAATGSGTGDSKVATTHGTATIVIKNFAFNPADPTVTAGERIVVENEDSVVHTFTASRTPAFNTGPILPHMSKTVVAPEKPGQYPFFCLIHQFMTGSLTVKAPK
ncbi:MAG: cupredoxin domain-containing protein [Acidimicrobiales bacterium]